MDFRLKGLVKFFNRVREQLQYGLSEPQLESLKNEVAEVVRQVEKICAKYGKRPRQLPTPSRKAYQFLKNIDWENVTTHDLNEGTRRNRTVRITNMVKVGDYFAQRFWKDLSKLVNSADCRKTFLKEIRQEAVQIEGVYSANKARPSQLSAQSQQVYSWLKFLSDQENLDLHIQSLQTASKLIKQNYRSRLPIEIQLLNMKALYRMRGYKDVIVVKCNEGFINADEKVWSAVLSNLFVKTTSNRKKIINNFALSEDFCGVLFELESFIEDDVETGKGHVYDLESSFKRINQQYFDNRIAKPKLKWNRVLTVAKMGHYDPRRDTVMLSISLDHRDVPEYVVDFVMYHELLHKMHGESIRNGRRFVHTPEFRREERQFAYYHKSVNFLITWARKQRG